MILEKYLSLSYLLSLANIMGFIGGIFYVGTMVMKTMVPLRVAAIASNFFLGLYGLLANSIPTFFLYALLLPVNCVRLYQMLQLVKKVKSATQGDLSMEWLKPFMTKRNYYKGDVLFRKGDVANEMFFIVSGAYRVTELNVDLAQGHLLGEMGLLAPDNRRTQSVECTESGQVLTINYDKVRELYFQNPEFGFYFLRLTSERLMQNVARLERIVEQNKLKIAPEAADGTT
ncbi:MAG TPA: cyclic nucleotide-binding domain-containing protein [Pseudorhodoplanes sp.]|nr:cyclic nucleotide-binding domain-containing protein [Pseudorhodoplanes sp.]